MKNNDTPYCAADAMRRVKPVEVNGATVGPSMLDFVFAVVHAPGRAADAAVRAELMKCVKIHNYIQPAITEAYATAVHREYAKWTNQGGRL